MKIAFIVPSLANKGPVIVVKNLVNYLVSKNFSCEVFYFSNIKELSFKCKTTKISLFNLKAVDGFDIIHSHGIRPDLYSFINPHNKIKKISTLHNYIRLDLEQSLRYSKFKSKFFEILWNIFLIRMDKIVVLSNDAKEYYNNILYNKSISVVYNGLSFNEEKECVEEVELFDNFKMKNFKIIGSNAYLTHRKGLHQIIKALPKFSNLVFVVVGNGPEKQNLEKLALKHNVKDRCVFLGYKTNAVKYLNFFDYFAIPSYSEGFPLSLIEAAAYKKPTIASSISIHKEVFTKNEVSFVTLDDEESMIGAINYLINNENSLANNIFDKYIKYYTLECMSKNYINIYKKVITV